MYWISYISTSKWIIHPRRNFACSTLNLRPKNQVLFSQEKKAYSTFWHNRRSPCRTRMRTPENRLIYTRLVTPRCCCCRCKIRNETPANNVVSKIFNRRVPTVVVRRFVCRRVIWSDTSFGALAQYLKVFGNSIVATLCRPARVAIFMGVYRMLA